MPDINVFTWFLRERSDLAYLEVCQRRRMPTVEKVEVRGVTVEIDAEPEYKPVVIVTFYRDGGDPTYLITENGWYKPGVEDLKDAVSFIRSRMAGGSLMVGEDDEILSVDGVLKNNYLHAMQVFIWHQKEKHSVRRIQNELNQTPELRRYAPLLLDIVLGLKSITKNYPASNAHGYLEIHLIVLKQAIDLFKQRLNMLWGGEDEDEKK